MAGPVRTTFTSNPIQSFGGWDSITQVLGVLQEMEWGNFMRPALFADALSRDDRIDGVIRTRIGGLLGAGVDVKPADKRAKSDRYAKILGGTSEAPGKWEEMFPPGVISEILRFGYLLNFAVAEILWSSVDGLWMPRLKFWDTQFVRWDWVSMNYKLQTTKGEIDLPRYDEKSMGDGKWFVWCPGGYQYAWRRGMLRSLAAKFVMRQWTYRDFARFCEIHGLCLVKAIVPGDGGSGDGDRLFLSQVANRGNEPTIMVPQGAEGNKYDVQYVEAVSLSWKSFGEFKAILDTDIAVLVLGQNLTTEASGGGLGGGEANTHNSVRLDKAREDANLAAALRQQVLMPMAKYNWGDPELAPRPIYKVEPPENLKEKAETLKLIGDGVASLKGASDRVDPDAILEEFGLALIDPAEAAAIAAVREEQNAQRMLGPVGGGDNGGGGDAGAGGDAAPGAGGAESADDVSAQASVVQTQAGEGVVKRYDFAGLSIAVENPRGTVRRWVDSNGAETGSTSMLHDYGFIDGHIGSDKEELDCYVGPFESASDVHIVHQLKAPDFKARDEDKIMLGFADAASAKQAFLAHRNDGARSFGTMTTMPLDTFKAKLARRTGTGIIRAAAAPLDKTFTAIMALADRAAEMRAGEKGRDYPEALTKKAVILGAKALAPLIVGLRVDIKNAETFDDLIYALLSRYQDEKNKQSKVELARLIARTRLMSNLAGRLAIAKEAK